MGRVWSTWSHIIVITRARGPSLMMHVVISLLLVRVLLVGWHVVVVLVHRGWGRARGRHSRGWHTGRGTTITCGERYREGEEKSKKEPRKIKCEQ